MWQILTAPHVRAKAFHLALFLQQSSNPYFQYFGLIRTLIFATEVCNSNNLDVPDPGTHEISTEGCYSLMWVSLTYMQLLTESLWGVKLHPEVSGIKQMVVLGQTQDSGKHSQGFKQHYFCQLTIVTSLQGRVAGNSADNAITSQPIVDNPTKPPTHSISLTIRITIHSPKKSGEQYINIITTTES